MNLLSRALMFLSVSMLASLYFFPLWQISLYAPQYPDGVTMYIFIDKLGGSSPGTLQNVNILNHYVGMKAIDPASIPELRYFPVVIGVLILLGFIAMVVHRKTWYLSWSLLLIVLSILGFYDFYLWEYDYGHSLSPDAPIKIPGASFQPPLFGWKTIINFEAYSGPQLGGWFAGCAILFSFLAYLFYRKLPQRASVELSSRTLVKVLSVFLVAASMPGCQIKPDKIYYGEDLCANCKMTIVDFQHAAQLVTDKGKVYKYDAIECMLGAKGPDDDYRYILVNDYLSPGNMIDATKAIYLISKAIPSPMGANLSAFTDITGLQASLGDRTGTQYNWSDIKNKFIH